MTPKLKVTASSRGGVESNRKRTGSPQDNELDSAGCDDEPAHSWRSPESVQHAGNGGQSDAGAHRVVGGGMLGSLRETSGETCRRGDGGRSQRPNSTDAAALGERRGQQNHAEGSGSGRERKKRRIQVTDERKGTECQGWLGKFPMTGRSVLQNRAIDLKSKGLPADDSGNGIGDASPRYSTCSHCLGRGMDSQSRCGNSRLESRVRENRTHGSEAVSYTHLTLPTSDLV